MRPIIGLAPQHDARHQRVRMAETYIESIEKAGGAAVVLPLGASDETLRELIRRLDGFLMTGGADVAPARYGEEAREVCGETDAARDDLEFALLPLAFEANKPVLGICRGLQVINVSLGGTLHQDLAQDTGTGLRHDQESPYDQPSHEVRLVAGNPLFTPGLEAIEVNSIHHQGVKALAPGLEPMAYAPDGLIEAFYDPRKRFMMAVQWHPECTAGWDLDSQVIFGSFINACKEGKEDKGDEGT